jgi:hypothetical protein
MGIAGGSRMPSESLIAAVDRQNRTVRESQDRTGLDEAGKSR